jgi:hypothetical protein
MTSVKKCHCEEFFTCHSEGVYDPCPTNGRRGRILFPDFFRLCLKNDKDRLEDKLRDEAI